MSKSYAHILGCGTSSGVPSVSFGYGDCDPDNKKNTRLRASAFVHYKGINILIDASPDCRQQLLNANIKNLQAVLFTHAHADHCHGLDDLRWVCFSMNSDIPVYGSKDCIDDIKTRFSYAFSPLDAGANNHYYKPVLIENYIAEGVFHLHKIPIIAFEQDHGFSKTFGFRIGDFAYSTDVVGLGDTAFQYLKGVKIWVVDALQHTPHPTHSHLAQTLKWIEKISPDKAYLTHMNHRMDYENLMNILPRNVEPAYDNLIIPI